MAAYQSDGFDMKLINQPPNTPDCNVLDIEFFNAMQSLQDRTTPRHKDELIAEVKRVFNAQ